MRISFSEDVNAERSGKHKFLSRLNAAFERSGHIHVGSSDKADVHLMLPGGGRNKRAKVNILRLDGLMLQSADLGRNAKLAVQASGSDGVVYQGEFCRRAYQTVLGISQRYAVIPNGADPKEFLPRSPSGNILANAKWRPHKRLDAICEGYSRARRNGFSGDLIITGTPERRIDGDGIRYIGWQDSSQLRSLLSSAAATVHLTWLDWCPNSMVESVVAGCPVVYTDSGGHTEIASGSGVSVSDRQWNFKLPLDHYHPPKLDLDEVAMAIIKAAKMGSVSNPALSISVSCDRYVAFFESVLETV